MYSSRFSQNFVSKTKEKNQLKVIIVLDEKIHHHYLHCTYLFVIHYDRAFGIYETVLVLHMWLLHNAH